MNCVEVAVSLGALYIAFTTFRKPNQPRVADLGFPPLEKTGSRRAVVLDLRPAPTALHVNGSLRVSHEDLRSRLCELPKKQTSIIHLLGPDLEPIKLLLEDRGWKVGSLIGALRMDGHNVAAGTAPMNIVCDPCPSLSRVVYRLEHGARVLDFGAGSGRDTIWLATRGFKVTAVDQEQGMLDRLERWLARFPEAVRTRVRTSRTRLRGDGKWKLRVGDAWVVDPKEGWMNEQYDLVLAARFFHRSPGLKHFPKLVRRGGFILWNHFCDVNGDYLEKFRSPKDPARIVKPGELEALFAPPDWNYVFCDYTTSSDGRPMVEFCAQRR